MQVGNLKFPRLVSRCKFVLFLHPELEDDYKQKKLCALNMMRQKHVPGQIRTPNQIWSGMGFSNSMPESAIRDKLKSEGVGSKMTQPNEDSIQEEDEDGGSLQRTAMVS